MAAIPADSEKPDSGGQSRRERRCRTPPRSRRPACRRQAPVAQTTGKPAPMTDRAVTPRRLNGSPARRRRCCAAADAADSGAAAPAPAGNRPASEPAPCRENIRHRNHADVRRVPARSGGMVCRDRDRKNRRLCSSRRVYGKAGYPQSVTAGPGSRAALPDVKPRCREFGEPGLSAANDGADDN